MEQIINALQQLDPNNDEHWTQEGLPRLDVLKQLTGIQELTRQAVTNAAPEFNRETAPEFFGEEEDGDEEDGDEEGGGPSADYESEEGDKETESHRPDELPNDIPHDPKTFSETYADMGEKELGEQLDKINRFHSIVLQHKDEIQRRLDAFIIRRTRKENGQRESQLAIQSYLKQQRTLGEEKAQIAKERGHESILSDVDKSFNFRPNRATQRPRFGQQGDQGDKT